MKLQSFNLELKSLKTHSTKIDYPSSWYHELIPLYLILFVVLLDDRKKFSLLSIQLFVHFRLVIVSSLEKGSYKG